MLEKKKKINVENITKGIELKMNHDYFDNTYEIVLQH